MNNFTPSNFLYPYYHRSYYNRPLHTSKSEIPKDSSSVSDNSKELDSKKKTSNYNRFIPIQFSNPFLCDNPEDPVLEILGIQLYLDDLIILGLLFFLYKENVKDELLFFLLILLLMS